jgi:serine phosphatase RsbU (regulator of sigma subunit)/DNA-binding NarL/FixJ family response regulator
MKEVTTGSDKRIILLVDDTPADIQAAHHILKDAYIVKIATSGARALDIAKVVPQPDLILLDVMMPEMDGYEVCRQLKADPDTRDIPVIFLTGKTSAEAETRGFELGAIDYIHKPFSPLVVHARARTHLALREASEQLSEEKRKLDRLLEEAERIFGLIFDYAARMGAEPDPDKLLRLNADMARDLVCADRCSIWLRQMSTGELWTKVAHGLPEVRIAEDHGLVGACIATDQAIVVNDASKDPRFDGDVDRSSGYVTHSLLALPLRSPGSDVLGALQVLNKPGGFQETDVKLLGLAASFSASALVTQSLRQEAEAARLVFRELEIAREVQRRLFPSHPPHIPGLDIAAYCRPAHFVGGDYYDFLSRSGSDLWFTVGDVSGKGISAAVLMASLQASLRSQINARPNSVADVVSELNRDLCFSFGQERYTTLFCARLDPIDCSLTYVNAGHVQPVLLQSSGEFHCLDCGGLPVGLFESATYTDAHVRLRPGDVLACFSDGITEATKRDGQMWEESEIRKLLYDNRYRSADELVHTLIQGADNYMESGEQADDMTLVILRVLS